jgi:hypothetical protein
MGPQAQTNIWTWGDDLYIEIAKMLEKFYWQFLKKINQEFHDDCYKQNNIDTVYSMLNVYIQ